MAEKRDFQHDYVYWKKKPHLELRTVGVDRPADRKYGSFAVEGKPKPETSQKGEA